MNMVLYQILTPIITINLRYQLQRLKKNVIYLIDHILYQTLFSVYFQKK